MISIGGKQNFVRFSPNPGFTFKIWSERRLHWCKTFGWGLLRPEEFCSRYRKGNFAKVKEKNNASIRTS